MLICWRVYEEGKPERLVQIPQRPSDRPALPERAAVKRSLGIPGQARNVAIQLLLPGDVTCSAFIFHRLGEKPITLERVRA